MDKTVEVEHERYYEQMCSSKNLYKASKSAMKGKKSKGYVAKFWLNEDREVATIQQELREKRYTFGKYKEFIINDNGVDRRISAAPFRDRVVHHAITQIIELIFDKSFIYDSYANRKGKGTLKALQRAHHYAKRFDYVLQLDIRKYFPSIDHDVLMQKISKKIEDRDMLDFLTYLVAHSNKQDDCLFYFEEDSLFTPYERKKGLPLGNQTSQFFGNIYLNDFDHYIKEKLKIKGYIRYVDDMLFFHNTQSHLQSLISTVTKELEPFRLKIHPNKIKLLETKKGFVFLGHKVYDTHFRLTSKAIRRGRINLKKVKYEYRYKKLNLAEAKNRIFGTVGFFALGNNYKITDELLAQTLLRR